MEAVEVVSDLLADLYPGDDPAIAELRKELARVSCVPVQHVLLEGPPNCKTTMARQLAVCRDIQPFRLNCPDPRRARRETLLKCADMVPRYFFSWFGRDSGGGAAVWRRRKVRRRFPPRIGIFEQQ